MTDNEIKKALECCLKSNNYDDCEKLQCPLYRECKIEHKAMEETVIPYALDLINRLQAENEDLKSENLILSQKRFNIFENLEFGEKIKAEAYKEFAERVKMEFYYEFDELIPSIMADKIDNLLKEKVGE